MADKAYKAPPLLFATAAKGTEGALRDELRELGFRGVRADRGGVHFAGNFDDGLRACIELRTAIRVLYKLAEFEAPDEDALYEGVRAIEWSPYLSARHTLAVRAACKNSRLTHSQYIAQKTKDAIVDQLRARSGARPSVDRDDPDVLLFVHLVRDVATVYLDISGESLHRRGYRERAREAPLKETLAAAILRLGGWDRERPLCDPMCGSGTLAIEAALWAQGIAPGLLGDRRFGLERWACHDEGARKRASELRERARAKAHKRAPRIVARDVDLEALMITRDNARAAGVTITVERGSVTTLSPMSPPGFVVVNPPYGERLEASPNLYRDMADAFSRLRGHRIAVLAGAPSIVRPIRMKPSSSLVVFNGDIECRLLTYDVPG